MNEDGRPSYAKAAEGRQTMEEGRKKIKRGQK